jgi:Tfp pilus assembly PilM family ATPase
MRAKYLSSALSIYIEPYSLFILDITCLTRNKYSLEHYIVKHYDDLLLDSKGQPYDLLYIAGIIKQYLVARKRAAPVIVASVADKFIVRNQQTFDPRANLIDIENMLQSEIEQYVPYQANNTIFDFCPALAPALPQKAKQQSAIFACERSYLTNYQQLAAYLDTELAFLGVQLQGVYLAQQYIAKSYLAQASCSNILFIHIEQSQYMLCLYDIYGLVHHPVTARSAHATRAQQGSLLHALHSKDDTLVHYDEYMQLELARVIPAEVALFSGEYSCVIDAVLLSGKVPACAGADILPNYSLPVVYANPFASVSVASRVDIAALERDAPRLLGVFGSLIASM